MAEGLTDREKFLNRIDSLALSVLPITELPMVAAPDAHHDGVMVALVPDDPEQLALDHEEALPADDLHVTLCYFGKIQDLSSFEQTKILSKTRNVVDSIGRPFSTSADGVVVMGKNDEGVPATALLIQADEIVSMYEALSDALDYKSDYPSFIPHMTAGYGVPIEDAQALVGQPITFSKVIVKFGDDVHDVPLPAALTAAPRGANVIDRVIDSLGRLWDEALHPRDGEGKFIKKNGAVSGKLAVPTKDRKSVTMVDANRASVVGFHTFGDDVWVLAEIKNPDGTTQQGFARATSVKAVAPVKARLDALYPVDDRGDAFINSSLERKRQLDLLLSHITAEYGPSSDEEGAKKFIDSLGLWKKDLDYLYGGSDDTKHLGGLRRIYHEPSGDELDEIDDIIEDAQNVKAMRDRVHGLQEDPDFGFSSKDSHITPEQRLLQGNPPDEKTVAALQAGADPFSLSTDNLLGAMYDSERFERIVPKGATGVSPIEWLTDASDQTGNPVWLAGASRTTKDRAYFVKQSIIGAELHNTDIVNEVTASLIAESVGSDERSLRIPRSVFGDNPEWDGESPPESLDLDDMSATHQPAHVVSQHAADLVPADWSVTDVVSEETSFRNDIRGMDPDVQVDQTAAFYEDIGDVYGNDVAKMILWDFVLLNGDRNPGNAILAAPPDGSEGVVLPIDHGFAFDEPFVEGDSAKSFKWFMNYQFTQAWLNYVLGGLRLNNNVSEDSLRSAVEDFSDVYGNVSVEEILSKFRALPGVTDQQVERVEQSLAGAVDRIAWIRDNMDTVLRALTGKDKALM